MKVLTLIKWDWDVLAKNCSQLGVEPISTNTIIITIIIVAFQVFNSIKKSNGWWIL